MTHVLVMQVKLPQDGDPDEAQTMLKDVVVPHAKSQAGFQRGTWMHDDAGNGMGVVAFATAENAEAAKDALKPPPGGPQLVSSTVYEIAAEA
jgi:hypothetical protein